MPKHEQHLITFCCSLSLQPPRKEPALWFNSPSTFQPKHDSDTLVSSTYAWNRPFVDSVLGYHLRKSFISSNNKVCLSRLLDNNKLIGSIPPTLGNVKTLEVM